MNQHPLIVAMKRAGHLTQRQADFLTRTNYGDNETGLIVNLAQLSAAMVDDWQASNSLNDRSILNDLTHPERLEARKRRTLRVEITDMLMRFPTEYREQLIDQLAAGKGAEEAHALQTTIDRRIAVMLAGIRANVELSAQTTA
jgi:hypothetical protein